MHLRLVLKRSGLVQGGPINPLACSFPDAAVSNLPRIGNRDHKGTEAHYSLLDLDLMETLIEMTKIS